jgi:fibronectin-binding autotransporter adhesin
MSKVTTAPARRFGSTSKSSRARMSAARKLGYLSIAVLASSPFAPAVLGQSNDNWTGTSSPNWTDTGNWSTSTVPTATNTAYFSTSTPNMTITLNGSTQTVGVIQFDTSSVGVYTLGSTPGDGTFYIATTGALGLSGSGTPTAGTTPGATGAIGVTDTVTSPQIINSNLTFTSTGNSYITDAGVTGSSATPSLTLAGTITISGGAGAGTLNIVNLAPTGNPSTSLTAITGTIVDGPGGAGSLRLVGYQNGSGTILFSGSNTYSGGTVPQYLQTTIIQLGSSSTFSGSSNTVVSGPLGTGSLGSATSGNGASSNVALEAVGADRILGNAIYINYGGLQALDAPTSGYNADATGPHNLTLAGAITFGDTTGRTITIGTTNTTAYSGTVDGNVLNIGLATNPTTFTLSNYSKSLNLAFTPINSGVGLVNFNDVIQDNAAALGTKTGTNADTISFGNGGTNVTMYYRFNAVNTYDISGNGANKGTLLSQNFGHYQINSTGGFNGTNIVGAFGNSIVEPNNTSGPPIFEAYGADRTLYNTVTLSNSGFFVDNPGSNGVGGDPSGPHNLTLAGLINETTSSRTITNNMVSGVALNLGAATNPSTITLGTTSGQTLTIQSQNGTNGGGVTVINDVIQDASGGGSGAITAQVGGAVYLNGNNTFSGGLNVNASTVVVSSDANMGSTSGAVNLVGASGTSTLLSTGTFTSARTFNFSAASGVIDVTGTNVLTLTGSVGGSGDLTKGSNSGTVQLAQSGGFTTANNVNVNGGTLAFGSTSSASTGPFSIGGTLTVNDGATASVISSGATSFGYTNSAATLTINGGGQLNLANSALITNTDPGTIRQYLINGYNGGAWNGTGGINSVNANANYNIPASNGGHFTALGYSSGTSTVGAALGLSAGQTLVKYTIYGDANLDGIVDINDLNIVLSNFLSGNPATWDTGDFYYAGQTDISDLDAVLSNYFDSAPSSVRAANAAAKASMATASTAKTLTGTVSPADTVSPPPANGVLELVVNTTSGDVELEGNNADIASLQITSASSGIITANWTDLHANGYTNWSDTAKKKTGIGEYDNQFTATGDYAVLGVVDYGDIYNTTVNAEDYVFKYGSVESNDTTVDTDTGSVIYVSGVPEPTTLSLMGLAAAGLMGRRRARRRNH